MDLMGVGNSINDTYTKLLFVTLRAAKSVALK
jgi:hypothetical protein